MTIGFQQRADLGKWDARFIRLAEEVATWSKGPRTCVGAVIVRPDRSIAALGYNGAPRGYNDDDFLAMPREDQHKTVIHAEANAILSARASVAGCTLYASMLPCAQCAGLAVQAGVSRVVAYCGQISPDWFYSAMLADEVFKQAGVQTLFVTGP